MRTTALKLLTLIIILFIIKGQASATTQTITGNIVSWFHPFSISQTERITTTLTWNNPTVRLQIAIVSKEFLCGGDLNNVSPLTCVRDNVAEGNYIYAVYFQGNPLAVQYTIVIRTDTAILLTRTGYASSNMKNLYLNYVNFQRACQASFTYSGPANPEISFYRPNPNIDSFATNPTYKFDYALQPTYTANIFEAGNWLVVITVLDLYLDIAPFTLNITSNCSRCGDAILSIGEQCDNGNKPGCSSGCLIDFGYECTNQIGASSFCLKIPTCGDGIVEQGEQCDNKNKPGCSNNCIIDSGFNCSAIIGQPSVCSICGNGIIQGNEQCDNFNQIGCSQNCKVDTGYTCRNTSPSVCSQNNPVCGNGIIEVAEGCDDRNLINGDGCNTFCNIQTGFRCLGALGQLSNCVRTETTTPICGNGIYEPVPVTSNTFSTPLFGLNYPGFIEQCDNGNKDGCYGCVIQGGWQCNSIAGQKSICSLLITVPTCGNRIYEPNLGQVCDDGNLLNGDGCNNRCQVQYGWICPNNLISCFIPPIVPPTSNNFCGNGRTQPPNEECDDGFPLKNRDGCSKACKIQIGWFCINQGVSKCVKS